MIGLSPAGGSLLADILMNIYKLESKKMNEIERELIIRKSI